MFICAFLLLQEDRPSDKFYRLRGNLLSFYKSCLSKNPVKRPAISELQDCFMAYNFPPKPSNIDLNLKTKQVNTELSINVGVRSSAEVEIVPEVESGDVDELVVGCCGDASGVAEVGEAQKVVNESEKVNPIKVKTFLCPLCGKGFARNSNVRRHVRIDHSEDLDGILPSKAMKCDLCSKSYNRKHHLERHILTVHAGTAFTKRMGASLHAKQTVASRDLNPILSPYEKIREINRN